MPHDLPAVYVDATLVVQVLVNLFDNVAKYTPRRHARPHLRARRRTRSCA